MLTTIIIIILYPLITLGLVSLPFFWIKKHFKPLKWRHIFLGYFLGGIILIAWVKIVSWFDRWIYYNAYNCCHWILDNLRDAFMLSFLCITILFILSPIPIIRMLYGELDWKKGIICLILSIILSILSIITWVWIIAWGLGQIGMKYF